MKLTAELINSSYAFTNPVHDRELDLRGNKIPAIENLAATKDQFDTLDFSDNDIQKLENFPQFDRLSCVVLNNNRVSKIAPQLGESLKNLRTLILTNNRIAELEDLNPLSDLPTLTFISLVDNPVTSIPDYRYHVIHKFPNLKILDFNKIRQKERERAKELFGEQTEK